MKRVEPTISDMEQASRLMGILGGLAGFGTAIAAVLFVFYRAGFHRGREVERNKIQARDLKKIKDKLKGD